MIPSTTVLVTGCAGFIGSNFVKQLHKKYKKFKIIGIDDLSTGRKDALNPNVIFYKGSIVNQKLLNNIFSKHKPDYVFHFAALPKVSYSLEHPRHTSEVNIIGTVGLLELSKTYGVKRFIYSSSCAVYGNAKKLPTRESENYPNPLSPYAVQKYIGEHFCKIFSNLLRLDTVCLRYFNVFGPGQYGDSPYSTVISAWLESLYFPQKNKAFIEGNGNQSRDFCYVDNVGTANILAMEAKKQFQGEILNIASGTETKIKTVKKLIEQLSEKKLDLKQRPPRLGDIRRTHADVTQAKRLLSYDPTINFEEGLKKTIEWFKTRV